jgi:hypothetical protein
MTREGAGANNGLRHHANNSTKKPPRIWYRPTVFVARGDESALVPDRNNRAVLVEREIHKSQM